MIKTATTCEEHLQQVENAIDVLLRELTYGYRLTGNSDKARELYEELRQYRKNIEEWQNKWL